MAANTNMSNDLLGLQQVQTVIHQWVQLKLIPEYITLGKFILIVAFHEIKNIS